MTFTCSPHTAPPQAWPHIPLVREEPPRLRPPPPGRQRFPRTQILAAREIRARQTKRGRCRFGAVILVQFEVMPWLLCTRTHALARCQQPPFVSGLAARLPSPRCARAGKLNTENPKGRRSGRGSRSHPCSLGAAPCPAGSGGHWGPTPLHLRCPEPPAAPRPPAPCSPPSAAPLPVGSPRAPCALPCASRGTRQPRGAPCQDHPAPGLGHPLSPALGTPASEDFGPKPASFLDLAPCNRSKLFQCS